MTSAAIEVQGLPALNQLTQTPPGLVQLVVDRRPPLTPSGRAVWLAPHLHRHKHVVALPSVVRCPERLVRLVRRRIEREPHLVESLHDALDSVCSAHGGDHSGDRSLIGGTTQDHFQDHLYPQAKTTSETTTVEPPENPTNKGQDHLQDHPRPPAPGIGVGWGPCKGTTPPAPTATIGLKLTLTLTRGHSPAPPTTRGAR